MMMAKKRKQRYPSPEGLIIDLECLLHDEAPRIAGKDQTSTLAELATGETDERPVIEEAPRHEEEHEETDPMVPIFWVYVLGAALALSVVLNLVLAVK